MRLPCAMAMNAAEMLCRPEEAGMRIERKRFGAAWVMVLVFIVALLSHVDLAPLEETHWDAPIYVQLSKRAAETHMLDGYRQHAREIQPGPAGAHWHFTRIGHILLLGEVTRLFGSSETALLAMQWLYRLFMASGVTLCVVVGLRLVKLFRSEKPDSIWWVGYAIAAVTYVASDSYRGLQGHLVSEPPAFASLVLFALTLLWAVERRSMMTAALAGGLLFLLFFIRADTVLFGAIFLIVLAAALAVSGKGAAWQYLALTCLAASTSYAAYAWWFSPLVDPLTLVEFSSASKEEFRGLPLRNLIQIVIAGGFLWIGAGASLAKWRDPLVRFAAAWLVLAVLPRAMGGLQGAFQVRMAFFLALPLLVLAGEGWSWILARFFTQKDVRPLAAAIGLLALLALTPHAMAMRTLRALALQHLPLETQRNVFFSASEPSGVRRISPYPDSRLGLLVRPMGERQTFEYPQLRQIGAFLYEPERPAYLLWPRLDTAGERSLQEHVGLLRYFGKPYPESADIVLARLPNKIRAEPCTARVPTALEPLVFCTALTQSEHEQLRRRRIPLYVLGADGYPLPEVPLAELKTRLSIRPYTLYEAVEQ